MQDVYQIDKAPESFYYIESSKTKRYFCFKNNCKWALIKMTGNQYKIMSEDSKFLTQDSKDRTSL